MHLLWRYCGLNFVIFGEKTAARLACEIRYSVRNLKIGTLCKIDRKTTYSVMISDTNQSSVLSIIVIEHLRRSRNRNGLL